MSLREELEQLIRLQIGQTPLGDEAVMASAAGEKAWGTSQAAIDMLVAYCTGLNNAVLRLADEIEDRDRLSGRESG